MQEDVQNFFWSLCNTFNVGQFLKFCLIKKTSQVDTQSYALITCVLMKYDFKFDLLWLFYLANFLSGSFNNAQRRTGMVREGGRVRREGRVYADKLVPLELN